MPISLHLFPKKSLETVEVFPKMHASEYKSALIKQLQMRPYWCISRQRCWGVPIPVFYDKSSGECVINRSLSLGTPQFFKIDVIIILFAAIPFSICARFWSCTARTRGGTCPWKSCCRVTSSTTWRTLRRGK